ncbi:MAG: hypothetical protein LBJ95_03560 [Oscillospiraceae bacterium]|nr:hypothetical protein [Oscillospiraceae bacterium]
MKAKISKAISTIVCSLLFAGALPQPAYAALPSCMQYVTMKERTDDHYTISIAFKSHDTTPSNFSLNYCDCPLLTKDHGNPGSSIPIVTDLEVVPELEYSYEIPRQLNNTRIEFSWPGNGTDNYTYFYFLELAEWDSFAQNCYDGAAHLFLPLEKVPRNTAGESTQTQTLFPIVSLPRLEPGGRWTLADGEGTSGNLPEPQFHAIMTPPGGFTGSVRCFVKYSSDTPERILYCAEKQVELTINEADSGDGGGASN